MFYFWEHSKFRTEFGKTILSVVTLRDFCAILHPNTCKVYVAKKQVPSPGKGQTRPSVNMPDVISETETCQRQTPKIKEFAWDFPASGLSSYVKTQSDSTRRGVGVGEALCCVLILVERQIRVGASLINDDV